LSGALPTELAALENLEVLWLFKNQFSGPLLQAWGSSLLVLDVYENQLTGRIPGNPLSNVQSLQQLVLGKNQFSGPIPNAVGALSELTVLNVEDNALTGDFPSTLGALGNLVTLRLGNNPGLGGEIPALLFDQLTSLEEMRMSGLALTGDLNAQDWGNLLSLRVVDFSNNNFEGFPVNITVCENLEELNLSNNPSLGGNIPEAIDELANLKVLMVASSGLIGNLTDAVGNLPALGTLILSTVGE